MKPVTALLFAFSGVLMLVGVGLALSMRSLLLALVFLIAFVAVTGIGFVYKARLRKKRTP